VLAALVCLTVVTGIAHAWGVRSLPVVVSAMHVHVAAALASLPLAAWHVGARPTRVRRTDLSRRTLLATAAVAGGAGALWSAAETAQRGTGAPGARRRFTGSHEAGSDDPAAMPVVQWLGDAVQRLDAAAHAVTVRVPGAQDRVVAARALGALGEETVRAVLDCTSGWWSAQDWRGVRLDRVVGPAGDARSVLVRSTTGYARRFPVGDLRRLWLATGYAAEPLRPGHGGPVRLLAPGRRGFWWVKWVAEVQLDHRPWWVQPPFPLR
jgi:DMSO/TMAO reductase YedYZ molybdopterin-dependent catalytic subunit